MTDERRATDNTGLAKVAVQCSADTFVVKIATFAKPLNVRCKLEPTEIAYLKRHQEMKHINKKNIPNVWTLHFTNYSK
jgi:hypothetical protein